MLELVQNLGAIDVEGRQYETLCLDYDQRTKGRLRATSESGKDLGLFLERGKLLKTGDVLSSESGDLVIVQAADEQLVEARVDDWSIFSRCCYHLGNRHVPLAIGEMVMQFRPDHILEDMVIAHGMTTEMVSKPFNPEQGAYAGGHSHSHSHGHTHSHSHSHSHSHEHGHSHEH